MTEKDYIHLQGRIAALEVLMRLMLTAAANSQGAGNEVAALDAIERETLATLQFAERNIGEFEDAVWSQMVDSIKETIANARARY